MIKRKNIRKLFIVFSIVLMNLVLSGNSYADEKKKFKWISFEVEMARVAGSRNIDEAITINQVPLYLRTIPVHRDDPYFNLTIPLPDESPYSASIETGIFDFIAGLKVWFLSTIGFGIGLRAMSPELVTESGMSIGALNEYVIGKAKYDYSRHYWPIRWGATYIMYQVGITEKGKLEQLRYFIEVKTPNILKLRIGKADRLGFQLFAGYEPINNKIAVYATNGWHRWGKFELKDQYRLGELNFNGRVYGGLNIEFIFHESVNIGFKLFISKDLAKTKIYKAGKDFGLEFKDLPIIFGVGSYYFF